MIKGVSTFLGRKYLVESMADSHHFLTTSQLGATGLQSENGQGSRKRKQNMPPSAAHTNDTKASTSIMNKEPNGRTPQVIMDKKLSASISAVVMFGISEEIARACALDMINSGKLVNSATLLEESELRYQAGNSQVESYSDRLDTARLDTARHTAVSETEPAGASSACTSSQYAAPSLMHLPIQSVTQNSSENSSPPSVYNISTTNSHETNNGVKSSEFKRNNISLVSSDPHPHISSQSRTPSDLTEDCVDGYLSPAGGVSEDSYNSSVQKACAFSGGAAASISHVKRNEPASTPLTQDTTSTAHDGTLNDLNSPSHLSYQAAVTDNLIPNLVRQNSVSSNRSHSGGSQDGPRKIPTELSNVKNSSGNMKNAAVSDRRGDTETSADHQSDNQERTQPRRESLPNTTPLLQDKAQHINTCFKLVEKEHALLEKSRICSVCLVRPRDVTFLPCGHFSVCRTCAEPIYACPSCNKNILATVDTYLS